MRNQKRHKRLISWHSASRTTTLHGVTITEPSVPRINSLIDKKNKKKRKKREKSETNSKEEFLFGTGWFNYID